MTCNDYFHPYVDWLNRNINPPGTIGITVSYLKIIGIANRPNQGCYYLEGFSNTYDLGTNTIIGQGTQYFNDRSPGNHPFNATATDKVGLTFALPNGPLTMTLESWNNGLMEYTLECKDNLLFGYCGDIALIISISTFEAD